MSNRFKVNLLALSGQLVTADVSSVYLNGTAVGGATVANLQSTGQQAWTAANANALNLSGNAATTGATLVARDNSLSGWTAQRPMVVSFVAGGGVVWASQPNTGAFFNGSSTYVTKLDLIGFTGVRLAVNMGGVAAAASGVLYLGYLGSFTMTPPSYLPIDTTVTRTRTNVTNTVVDSGWQPLAAGARSGVYVGLFGSSGSAAVSPIFGMVTAQFM